MFAQKSGFITMAMKDELKTVLLLSPQRMLEDHQVLESLHIVKNAKGTTYTNRSWMPQRSGTTMINCPNQPATSVAVLQK